MILLDTLYPPAPDQLVADCRALGAAGCWVYVLRRDAGGADVGVGGWTGAHVDGLHAAALVAPGIVVPGSVPPAGQACLDALRALHCDPLLATDLELYSLPPTWWEDQLEQLEAAAGVRGIDYGTLATLGAYDPGQPGWVAEWIRTGVLDPVPVLPAGRQAWQFVNDVTAPSRSSYDASVVDAALLPGGDPVVTQELKLALVRLAYAAFLFGRAPSSDDEAGWANQIADDLSNLEIVLAGIQASPEATEDRVLYAQLREWAQSGGTPKHTHPITLPSGTWTWSTPPASTGEPVDG